MASPAQILANRQNAALSTGPATAAGREASSKNATRHNLTGVFTPFPHENAGDFEHIAARLRGEFKPEGENETFLVDQMIQARCRLHRIQRLEDHAYDQILTEPGSADDPDTRILAAMNQSGNLLDKIQRYRGAAERSYYKALRELQSSRVRNHRAESNALEAYIKRSSSHPCPASSNVSNTTVPSTSSSPPTQNYKTKPIPARVLPLPSARAALITRKTWPCACEHVGHAHKQVSWFLEMFFRREKPRRLSFSEYLDVLRGAGFTIQEQDSKARVTRGRNAAVIEDRGLEHPYVDRAGILIGDEIGYGVNGGYQSFVRTPSGKIAPALARDLKALHAFEEDLKEALGLTSLYNESLGTTFDQHMYDRVVNRDAGVREPWQQKTVLR